ncbi:MAG TPA: DinB family protein [Tepidisphaeraceae bacterium]|jgi:uncharacterized damage-inducible protein DinB
MQCKQLIRTGLTQSDTIVQGYLQDLTDGELLARPCKDANHIAWQLGHLIKAEHYFGERVSPGSMRPLPVGFGDQYNKQTCASDDGGKFLNKAQYLELMKQVRADTLKLVDKLSDSDLDKPVDKVPPFIKTAGEALLFNGSHWLMHAGQWAVTRRTLGRPPLF